MNVAKLRAFLVDYRRKFASISQEEIYKWQAVKTFQSEWNLEDSDFASMLERALSRTGNLMDSGNYFPRRMVLRIANLRPSATRAAFTELFNEEVEVLSRIHPFQDTIRQLNRDLGAGKNDYQDDRAVLVYLCMRYPESYYLYSKQLGTRGELLVIEWEKSKHGDDFVVHVSQSEGDGAGYDLRSVADDGSLVHIEVKTTTGGITTPFEVTRNELAFSEDHSDSYRLYRLYEFDEKLNRAKCFVIKGSLAPLCDCPVRFRVHLSNQAS